MTVHSTGAAGSGDAGAGGSLRGGEALSHELSG